MIRILLLLIGYLFGCFQTGYFYGKLKGIDLEKEGSGNTGATNAFRVMGVSGALIVYFFDMLKALIPCLLVRLITKNHFPDDTVLPNVYLMYTALGAVLGNDFPFFRKFKGGKGVSATSGVLFSWNAFPTAVSIIAVFAVITFFSGYVSVASMISAVLMVVSAFLYGNIVFRGAVSSVFPAEFYVIVILIALLLLFQHRSNIKRLMTGTENRFGHHEKEKN